jgi:hypothetical protein
VLAALEHRRVGVDADQLAFGLTLRMRCASAPEPVPRSTTAGAPRRDVDGIGRAVDEIGIVGNQRGDHAIVFALLDPEMCRAPMRQIPSEAARCCCQASISAALIASP